MTTIQTNHTESVSGLPEVEQVQVLYVEDDHSFANLTTTVLEDEDSRFAVEAASTPTEGLELLDGDIDCIVSDYNMPGMDGIEFLRTVREEYADLPFILFTGKGSEEVASEAISAGVTDYLQKESGTDQYTVLANRIQNAVEQDRTRTALEFERRRFRSLFDQFSQSIAELVYEGDDPIIRQVNQAFEETFGYDAGELVGESLDDYIVPDDRTAEADALNEQVQTTGELVCEEVTREAADGPRDFLLQNAVCDGATRVFAIYTDITERTERKRELEVLRAAVDNAHVPMLLTDPTQEDNPLVYVNEAFEDVTGYTASEAVGRNCRFLQGDQTSPDAVDRIREAMEAEKPVTIELRNHRKDGTMFWNRLSIQPVYDKDGSLIRYFASQEDITECKERHDALVEQNERLDWFTRTVSHDLQNPLRTASGYLELAREECECECEYLDSVAGALDRSQRLIDDLLTTARSGVRTTEMTVVDVSDVVPECWETIESHDAMIEIDTTQTIRADQTRFQQLLENLMQNAIKHGGDAVTVTVGALDDGFYVEDDGPGIPEDKRDDVFETGYSTAEDGMGFGLSIVKQITDAHGWEIRVTDSSKGGARFEITGAKSGGA